MRYRALAMAIFSAVVLSTGVSSIFLAEEAAQTKQDGTISIGTKTSDEDYAVNVTNETGMNITGICISVDGEEYSENLLDGAVFEAGAKGVLYCTPKELEAGATSAPRYDIKISYEGEDRTSVLHTFPFGDCQDAVFMMQEVEPEDTVSSEEDVMEESTEAQDGSSLIAYLKFVSISRGSEQDTFEHEKNIVYPPAVDPYAYTPNADVSYDYSYDSGQDYSYSEPVYEAPVYDGGGEDDDCMTDGLLN